MKAKCARSADSKRLIVYFRRAYCFQRKLRSLLEKLNSRCWSGISTGTKLANITTFFNLHLSVLSRKAPVLPLNQSLSLAHAQFAHTVFTITLLHLLLFLCVCLCLSACVGVDSGQGSCVRQWGENGTMWGLADTGSMTSREGHHKTAKTSLFYFFFFFSSLKCFYQMGSETLNRWNNVMQYNNEYDHCQQLGPAHPSVSRLPPKEHDKRLLELVLSFCPKHIQQLLSLPCHCLVFCVFFLHYLSLFVAVLCSVTPCSRLPGGKGDEAGKLWWESGPALSALHWRAP